MTTRFRRDRRRGALLVEAAFVYPVVVMLTLVTVVGGLGVFRYNQISFLAREGARWASVRGPRYQSEQGKSTPTAADVMAGAVTPKVAALDPNQLTPTLTWNTGATPPAVTFKLTYVWYGEVWTTAQGQLVASPSAVTFTSTSTQLVTY